MQPRKRQRFLPGLILLLRKAFLRLDSASAHSSVLFHSHHLLHDRLPLTYFTYLLKLLSVMKYGYSFDEIDAHLGAQHYIRLF